MNNHRSRQTILCSRRGSALVSVMGVVLITMLAVGSLAAFVASGVYRVRFLTDTIRAKAIAEAGANRAYSELRSNWDRRSTSTLYPNTQFGGGTYTVKLDPVVGDTGGRIQLTSIGTFGRATHRVGATLRDTYYYWFLDYALFSNGDTDFNGAPDIVGGVQANGDFNVQGVWTGISTNPGVSGQNFATFPEPYNNKGWASVPFPALDDPVFQKFMEDAEAAGTLTIIDGNLTIKAATNFTGITIIKGDLTLQVPKSQTATVDGMLYVTGAVRQNGQGDLQFTGTLLAGGDIVFNGAAGVFDYQWVDNGAETPVNIVVDGWWN